MEAELPSQRKPDKIFILMEVEERQEEWGERERRGMERSVLLLTLTLSPSNFEP